VPLRQVVVLHPRPMLRGQSQTWLNPFDGGHSVSGAIERGDLRDARTLSTRDQVRLGEVEWLGLVYLDSPQQQCGVNTSDRVESDQ
jgi:hypothetical protein